MVATAALDVAACRDAWVRALEAGRVDVRHWEDVGRGERDRLTALGLDSACWPWTATRNGNGYGQVTVSGSVRKAHRVAYVARHGRDIPAGITLDHLCRNRACANPAHLEPVTQAENKRRGVNAANVGRVGPPLCSRGHVIDGANVLSSPSRVAAGLRGCRACHAANRAASNRRRRDGWDPTPEDLAAFVQTYADRKAAEYAASGPAAGDLEHQDDDDGALRLEVSPAAPAGPVHACAGIVCRTTGCAASDPVIADAAAYDWWRTP